MPAAATTVVVGRAAEDLAVAHLLEQGYRVLARNHRCPAGEVDVIAWEGSILCFIEVRARRSDKFGSPLETIDRRKITRIGRACAHYLRSWQGPWPPMRFDALGVILSTPPVFTLVREAFEL